MGLTAYCTTKLSKTLSVQVHNHKYEVGLAPVQRGAAGLLYTQQLDKRHATGETIQRTTILKHPTNNNHNGGNDFEIGRFGSGHPISYFLFDDGPFVFILLLILRQKDAIQMSYVLKMRFECTMMCTYQTSFDNNTAYFMNRFVLKSSNRRR